MPVDLKNHPRFVELLRVAVETVTGPRNWAEDTARVLAAVSQWRFATDEVLPVSAVLPEVYGRKRGRELPSALGAEHLYGLSVDGSVIVSRVVTGPNSQSTQYITRDARGVHAVCYQERANADSSSRFQSVWIQKTVPESHSTFELILSAHGESRALVVRDGQTLTVSETCRAWDNMNKVVTSTVQLDDDGLPRLVTSADGRVTYQRVVKLPKDLEAKATKALVSEIGSVIKRENKAEPTAGIVVVHGQGPELFPPDIYVVPSRLLPTVKDDTWLEPNRLETAGLEPTYLLSDPAPPWLANVNLRLNDEDVVARLLTAMKEATRQLATTKWPLKTPPSFVWLHDIEDGTWTPFHEGSGKL